MLTRSTVPRPAAQGSEAYEAAAEQQERSWLWHGKVNDRGATVQHADLKGGVARIRVTISGDVRGKCCIDHLDHVVRRDRCHEEPAFVSRWLEGLHEVADAANSGVGAKENFPETNEPVASGMSSAAPVGPVLENPRPDGVELAAPSL